MNAILRIANLCAVMALLPAGEAAAVEVIRVGGTGNSLGTMRMLADAFVRKHPDHQVTVLPSVGTIGAIKAIASGALDIGLSGRALSEEELKTGASATEYARTPLVFAVSAKSAVRGLTLDQLADVYSGRTESWADGTRVRPIVRLPGNDENKLVRGLSPALNKALDAAEKRTGLPFAATDQDSADKTEGTPGAIGVSTLSLITSEKRPLRALALDGVEPTLANGASGKYPYFKRFYLVLQPNPSAPVKRFVAFIQSPAGREILTQSGNWVP